MDGKEKGWPTVVFESVLVKVRWNDGRRGRRDREHGSSTRAKFLYNCSNTQHT